MEKKEKKSISNYIIAAIIIYIFLAIAWNLTRTDLPDPCYQNVYIKKIEKGEYFNSWFSLHGPFSRKLLVNNENINSIYADHNLFQKLNIKQGENYWFKISCLQAPSWLDFFSFNKRFDYELISIPNQKDKTLKQDSLLWTWNTYVFLLVAFTITVGVLYNMVSQKS